MRSLLGLTALLASSLFCAGLGACGDSNSEPAVSLLPEGSVEAAEEPEAGPDGKGDVQQDVFKEAEAEAPACKNKCGSACADLTSDPKHCGECGWDCRGGLCQDGLCVLPESAYTIPVLSLAYYPVQGDQLDPDATGLNMSLATVKSRVEQIRQQLVDALAEGTRYHGYSDSTATPSLQYTIYQHVEHLEVLPPSTWEIVWDGVQHYPDYTKILLRESICDLVENKGVKEVWLWGYHHGDIAPAESNMAGPYGDISNSMRYDDMPVCAKTYVLYHYNYGRDVDCAIEDHTHHLEAILNEIDKDDLFWDKFVNPYGSKTKVNGCGWTHFPPNGQKDYDWTNLLEVQTDCEDWNPQRTGKVKTVSCATWSQLDGNGNCIDDGGVGFKNRWMQSLPGKNNTLTLEGKPLRNWWDVKADFDIVSASKTGLLKKK